MLKSLKSAKWLSVAAMLMFVGATFQIADGHWIHASVCFAAATSFMILAKRHQKLEEDHE